MSNNIHQRSGSSQALVPFEPPTGSQTFDVRKAADHFRCVVCSSDPVDPHLCPSCAHYYCRKCLFKSHANQSQSCPTSKEHPEFVCLHCRVRCNFASFVQTPMIEKHIQALRSTKLPPPPIADDCKRHTGKPLSVYCRDCRCTICALCWTCNHQDHHVSPIEAIHATKRQDLSRIVTPEIDSLSNRLDDYISRRLPAREERHDRLKREGDKRADRIINAVKEAWSQECQSQLSRNQRYGKLVDDLKSITQQFHELANHSSRNRLVDEFQERRNQVHSLGREIQDALSHHEKGKEPLQIFKPWLPDWDVEERIDVDDVKGLVTTLCYPTLLGCFFVKNITWKVWVGNRRHLQAGNLVKQENGVSLDWRHDLDIYVTMTGREELKNYEFCIEFISGVDEDHLDGMDAIERDNLRHVAQSEIIKDVVFRKGEKLHFPRADLADWLSSGEAGDSLSFTFKVRPLTYEQKIEDLEIYYERRLEEMSAKKTNKRRRVPVDPDSSSSNGEDSSDELPPVEEPPQKKVAFLVERSGATEDAQQPAHPAPLNLSFSASPVPVSAAQFVTPSKTESQGNFRILKPKITPKKSASYHACPADGGTSHNTESAHQVDSAQRVDSSQKAKSRGKADKKDEDKNVWGRENLDFEELVEVMSQSGRRSRKK